jgi:hypothetical protein
VNRTRPGGNVPSARPREFRVYIPTRLSDSGVRVLGRLKESLMPSSNPIKRFLAFSAMLAAGGIVFAQTGTTPPAAQPKPDDLKIILMDGSILAGKLSVNELAIDTKFGPLKVPVDQVQSFMPGLNSHPTFMAQINEYVNNLAADTFADREKAQQALLRIGPDIRGELERLLKTAEAEKANRLQVILDDFQSQAADEDAPKAQGWVKDDVIVTPGFTVVGRITTASFSVVSPFGTLNLKLEDVRQAYREVQEKEDLRKNVSIAGDYFASRIYSNTSVRVAKGDKVHLTASGSIHLSPWNQTSSPDGNPNISNVSIGSGSVPSGTLVGRIGDGGPLFKIGSKHSFTADRAGVLQLGIASPGNYSGNSFPGEYQVKIRVEKK